MRALVVCLLAACSSAPPPRVVAPTGPPPDPIGPHKAAVAKEIQPLVDHEVISAVVVGVYDSGKREIYGFGKGPGGKAPDGHTLFELGSISKIYTSLLLADAIQRREVALETPAVELLPPGVTMPIKDKQVITLGELALHVSGLPAVPPSIAARPNPANPYAHYDENALYADLQHTELAVAPGEKVVYSNYGAGLLGFLLGRKIGDGYEKALVARILVPLGLTETYVTVPAAAAAHRLTGTNDDLVPVPGWTFDALAGAGAVVSCARDQLELVEDELDASAGGKQGLRGAMRFTQEPQLKTTGDNEGLGWQIDSAGRYSHSGGTGGFRSYIAFDPKTRRGVVILSATSAALVDQAGDDLMRTLAGETVKPRTFPTAAQLAPLAGKYDLSGHQLEMVVSGQRLYLQGEGARVRLVPFSDHEFWVESLQSVAAFEREGGKIARVVFNAGGQRLSAVRVDK